MLARLFAFCWLAAAAAPIFGDGAALPKISVDPSGHGFVTAAGPFYPMGVTYYRPGTGWAPQLWKRFDAEATRRDFTLMKALGVTCVRVFLSHGSFYHKVGQLDPAGLAKFDQFLDFAEAAGIRVQPTGPDLWEGPPDWGRVAVEDESNLNNLEQFWRLFAARYRGRHVIFAYELKNEPEVGWNDGMMPAWNQWLQRHYNSPQAMCAAWGISNAPGFGSVPIALPNGDPIAARILDFQHFRETVADEWTRRQAAAIKSADPEALVTVGEIQWSVPYVLPAVPRYYSGFRPERQAKLLDFLEMHFYPLAHGAYQYGGEIEEAQNLAYLECLLRETARAGKPVVLGEFGWYGGGKPRFDKGVHPFASEKQQAEYCGKVIATSAPYICGWLNWGLFDQPEASDCSEFTGLLTADGRMKAWGQTFRALAAQWRAGPKAAAKTGSEPELDWNASLVSSQAEETFRRAYLRTFLQDHGISGNWASDRQPKE